MYDFFFRWVLRRLPAEFAHHASFAALRWLCAIPGLGAAVASRCAPRDPVLRVRALGREFAGPLGLAAGFDKDARGPGALGALGFSFVEIGTVTAQAQQGNPKPRLFRLPADRALVNRMGFNNAGAARAANRLRIWRRRHPDSALILGVNIGKSRVVDPADTDAMLADYAHSASEVASVADYVVLNVSSPNTPGLRDLQAVATLRPLLVTVRDALNAASPNSYVPLLVKIAPDLADADVDAIADLVAEVGLDGVIATNTTVGRRDLATSPETLERIGSGGLSGAPLKGRALEVLARLRARLGDRATLISVGGVESAADVAGRLEAGANLVQAYTGLIYGGPWWVRRINRTLPSLIHKDT